MIRFLLDTNVLSEMNKPAPDPGVVGWIGAAVEDELALSVVSLAEINRGIERLAAGRRQSAYRSWLSALLARFDGRILPITSDIALSAGALEVVSLNAGRPMALADVLIAATARVHGLTLITRNERDFQALPLPIHNPWSTP